MYASVTYRLLFKGYGHSQCVAVSLVLHVGHVYFNLYVQSTLLPEMHETHCFCQNVYVHM